MDTKNDGLEKATPLEYGNFLVFMLDFWGVTGVWAHFGSSFFSQFPGEHGA